MTDKPTIVICPCCNHEITMDSSNTIPSPTYDTLKTAVDFLDKIPMPNNIVKLEVVKK